MPDDIPFAIWDWKTILALGGAVCLVFLGMGGCIKLATKHDAEIIRASNSVSTTNVTVITNSVLQ